MKTRLTAKAVDAIRPTDKSFTAWDAEINGLGLRVRPTGNKTWILFYRNSSGRQRNYTIGKHGKLTAMEARRIGKQLAAQVALGKDIQAERIETRQQAQDEANKHSLSSFIDGPYAEWRRGEKEPQRAEESLKRLRACFGADFGDARLEDLNSWGLERWRAKRLKGGASRATVNRDITDLKVLLNKAVQWGLFAANPLSDLKPLKTDRKSKVRFLSEDEESRLRQGLADRDAEIRAGRASANAWRAERGYQPLPDLDACVYADHLHPMVLLSMNTGMRRGEVFNLCWADVDLPAARLTVCGSKAKSGQTRHLPLNEEAVAVLRAWRAQSQSNDLVFPSSNGKPFNTIKKAWAALLSRCGIENFRWHDLRHHFASRLVMVGVALNTVRELLGHSSYEMTLRYSHLAPETKAAAVARLATPQPVEASN